MIRLAAAEELPLVQEIRRIVFIEGQNVPSEIERDGLDQSCRHVIAFSDGKPVGTLRIRETDEGLKLERIAVLEDYRNRGIGKAMIKFVLSSFKGKIYMNAQYYLLDYYKKMGFVPAGKKFLEAGIEHIKMEKN